MAVKTKLEKHEIEKMLSRYNLGILHSFTGIHTGTVETNYQIETSSGKYILRFYEGRSIEQVMFEKDLIDFLVRQNFPCPKIIPSVGDQIYTWHGKPYLMFEFVLGEHLEHYSPEQQKQVLETAAKLNKLTSGQQFTHWAERLTYDPIHCEKAALEHVQVRKSLEGEKKLRWLQEELHKLMLPDFLPKAVCHCDFHYTNVLFQDGALTALIDFDDANYTYAYFDLISFIHFFLPEFDHDTWMNFSPEASILDFAQARQFISIYESEFPIPERDKPYFFDILKLSILIDCLWYFDRGTMNDFFEKRKIDAINRIGREEFCRRLFHYEEEI